MDTKTIKLPSVASALRAVKTLIAHTGDDPQREGLQDTPARVVRAYSEWFAGYWDNPREVLKTFEDGAANYDELIHVSGIPFYSHCEHHMTPFFGTVDFGYVPSGKIVGLSKMNRLVDAVSRKLQVQERITQQLVDIFADVLAPKGVGCVVKATHLCVCSRGIRHNGCVTTTAAFTGIFKGKGCEAARAEFYALTR